MSKVISMGMALSLISDNITVGVGGFGGFSAPDDILTAMAESYSKCGSPKGLNIVSGISPGDFTEDGPGLSIIKEKGLISSIFAAHFGNPPAIGRAVSNNEIAGYSIPLGVYGKLLSSIASHQIGVVTKVGVGTYCDPRVEACCANEKAAKSGRIAVKLIEIDGEEYLLYPGFKIDLCILRGSYADDYGNISLEKEPLCAEQLAMAAAVHNSGGTVIVQVLDIVKRGSLDPRFVKIPGALVDYVVKARPENHRQCPCCAEYRPEVTGEARIEPEAIKPMLLSARKICARRAAFEVKQGSLVNLGIGMPDGVALVINEEGLTDRITFSIESGLYGGVPVQGAGLGASVNPDAILSITDSFNIYHGGTLDMSILGMGEADEEGNVNVSRFGARTTGPGGFIDITQSTRKVCFMGTFTSGHAEYEIKDGALHIIKDGPNIKFKKKVQQITFSGRTANKNGQEIMYITERGVFRLTPQGVELTEIAPGVDLEKDILSKMEFRPLISENLKPMDSRIFRDEKMGLSL